MSESRQTLSSSSSKVSEGQPKTYKCKKCPGDRIFTQHELAAHRQMHEVERVRAKLRSSSRPPSDGTLFTQVGSPPTANMEKSDNKKQSNKIYDTSVVHRKYNWA